MENMGIRKEKTDWKKVLAFYKGKKVLVTGFTGFKGSWMCQILRETGAEVTGYALKPESCTNLYEMLHLDSDINALYEDIRNYDKMLSVMKKVQPEIVFHLAAQPIVLTGYRQPQETYETNVMGTVNLLESIRMTDSVRSLVNITTDKVYENQEWQWGYRENDRLNGYDPYSNSKSCSELITSSYRESFFKDRYPVISTSRAGNVIGGGDFAENRIIPDCIRAAQKGEIISVRNPLSVRPYQHVLEPIFAYLLIAYCQWEKRELAGAYNVGPDDESCITTGELADCFCDLWGEGLSWKTIDIRDAKHEAGFLKLDCSRIKSVFGWKPGWTVRTAVSKTVEWTKAWLEQEDIETVMRRQIMEYMESE